MSEPEILTPAEVDRIERTWELGYETTRQTMALIRTVRALRAELGTIDGLLGYFAGLQDLAGEIRVEQESRHHCAGPLCPCKIRRPWLSDAATSTPAGPGLRELNGDWPVAEPEDAPGLRCKCMDPSHH